MSDIISGEIYKLKYQQKYKLLSLISILIAMFSCIYFFVFKNACVNDFCFIYLKVLYKFIILLVALYNCFFQEEYQYGTQKNLLWIKCNRKSIFVGKYFVQLLVLTVNYLLFSLIFLLFTLIKMNEFSDITKLLIVILCFYFVLIRAMILVDLFTIIWKNDYITFVLYFLGVNFFGLLVEQLLSGLFKLNKISESVFLYTIQGQFFDVFGIAADGKGIVANIMFNILISLIGICICIHMYEMDVCK